MIRLIAFVVCIAASLTAGVVTSSAMTIEKIVSPSGIEAWLVQEKAVPLVTLNYAFHGGASQDEADKAGTANLAADLLDEGAGDLDSKAYHDRLEKKAIELSFQVGRDYIHGTLRSLNEHREEAFDMLGLALASPRFDADAIERVRGQLLAAKARALSRRCPVSPRRNCATMCVAFSRGTSSKSRLSAMLTPKRPAC
jgi:zinc protease